jgi:hypothetical protein
MCMPVHRTAHVRLNSCHQREGDVRVNNSSLRHGTLARVLYIKLLPCTSTAKNMLVFDLNGLLLTCLTREKS